VNAWSKGNSPVLTSVIDFSKIMSAVGLSLEGWILYV
jgi:hypothetical protein